jgi:hypothetical protein
MNLENENKKLRQVMQESFDDYKIMVSKDNKLDTDKDVINY